MKINDSAYFTIDNYQNKRTFSSFLPGIAGKLGIPIWAFYVNRGQGIASFGIENKDNAMLEFLPANKSYQSVTTKGFRTFIKFKNKNGDMVIYEPFTKINQSINSKMTIAPYSLKIEEINEQHQLAVKVKYYIIPNENFGSLVRRVTVENLSDQEIEIEILDGLPEVVPYGLTNSALKEVSQTMSAWCRVYNLDNKMPFYRIKATTNDSPEVRKMEKGHFYLSYTETDKVLTPLVDPHLIFGMDTSFQTPIKFIEQDLSDYQGEQLTENHFPSALSVHKTRINAGSKTTINSLFGHVENEEKLSEIKNKVRQDNYLNIKEAESNSIHSKLTDKIFTKSSLPKFDNYSQQTFLDNILRGGFPVNISEEDKSQIYHIYSRKHGDLERDYNYFHLEASHYSQGNGNYRDVNQNRRCDNLFNPQVKDYDIKTFVNLIQADGYNPLVIKGSKYSISREAKTEILNTLSDDDRKLIEKRLMEPYTPGDLSSFIYKHNIEIQTDIDQFIRKIISLSDSAIDAEFGEGYWVDHWTYLLDLIENYLSVYPEKSKELFFSDKSYFFYDSYVKVKPRSEKYILTDLGPRQLDAIEEIKEKRELIDLRKDSPYQVRTQNGYGEIYKTSLFVKLLTLISNKISTLDPYGIGIEMEANKPGWYDALNGLPGIFGSSTPEIMELKRMVDFLIEEIDVMDSNYSIQVPVEIFDFISGISNQINNWIDKRDNFNYWNNATSLREEYREKVFYGFNGKEKECSIADLKNYLKLISKKLQYAIKQASKNNYQLYSTYYYYIPVEFRENDKVADEGYPYIDIEKFEQVILPPFLEGQVRAMKVLTGSAVKVLHDRVKNSELFDDKLKMFRLYGDLSEMPDDIGRARAFTSGWLENGSIWLHMEYKYLLELLKNGLYEDFYQAMEDCLIPFQDSERYGRSILENSSFIMSSSNPDVKNHGRGFIARLSGSTAEFLNIWSIMTLGSYPFKMRGDNLIFKPEPVIREDFFTKHEEEVSVNLAEQCQQIIIPENSFACSIFGTTLLIYHNPERKNTFPKAVIKGYKLTIYSGEVIDIDSTELNAFYSHKLREGEVKLLDVYL